MKTYQNKVDYLTQKRKFSDEEYLEYYKQGFSDGQVARLIHCSSTSIRSRRIKLNLVANYCNFKGKRNTCEELKEILIQKHKDTYTRLKQKLSTDLNFKKEYDDCARIRDRRNKRIHYKETYLRRKNNYRQYYLENRESILAKAKIRNKYKKLAMEIQDEKSLC